jgi:hypothetical protein
MLVKTGARDPHELSPGKGPWNGEDQASAVVAFDSVVL